MNDAPEGREAPTPAGLLYILNPLGDDDREQFPLLMTSVQSTSVLLRWRLLGAL